MASYTVVAIPAKDDYVWKLSSEKVPHMTLLFLGDTLTNLSHTVDFVGHVVDTSLCRFGLCVDHRDVLGPQQADVLFFEKWGTKPLEEFRANLLKNKDIFLAYNSTPQYEEWTPHLTMGYPATPAKPDDREYPISWVKFDKIALWTGDYTGPEFQLNDTYSNSPVAAYSDLTVDQALVRSIPSQARVSEFLGTIGITP